MESSLRRALARARDGKTLDADEATVLLSARGAALQDLMAAAARVRDAGKADRTVTWSRKVFVPLTRLCRDRCHYCTFATTPGRLPAPFLSLDEVLDVARQGAALGCKEALFTLGDRPEGRWPAAAQWLEEAGYDSTLSYVRAAAVAVLEETGLLPHLNPGVMTWDELQRLKPVAPSMGMMLETTAEVPAHRGSPDKVPAVRLRTLEDAGRLSVPFTTGLLVGIGESPRDRVDTVLAIRAAHARHGHVQEVIVQNFRAKPDTAMRAAPDAGLEDHLATIAVTRLLLGPRMRVQAPPNLVDLAETRALLAAGVDDWGGVSPLTPDHVNPERPWPQVDALRRATEDAGFVLRERLTAHPPYLAEPWLDPRLAGHVAALRDADGLAANVLPVGRPWQEPDGGLLTTGRSDLHATVDTTGRTADRRSDFDAVYGDWAALPAPRTAPRLDGDVAAALRAAERGALSEAQTTVLLEAQGADLEAVCRLADDVRRDRVGDDVSYVVNRNINFTNVCYTGCRFCAFAQRRTDADAYSLSLEEVAARAREAWDVGATEVCVQGGIDPALPGTAYLDLARAIKAAAPGLHLHAFSPMEVVNGAARTGLSIREFLQAVKEAGVDSLPGTAAEILDDEVRWVLTKGKLPTAQWVEVVTTAHEVGLPTTSTMMYGHVDAPHHWAAHLHLLRSLQQRTGGFTEFVPLPFVHTSAPIYLAGIARPGPTPRDNRAVHAVARLVLDGPAGQGIDHVQCSWVKLGPEQCDVVLRGGVDDLGGTLMEETISRMAGSQHGSRKSVEDLEAMVRAAGRTPRQRTTGYGEVPAERLAAARRVLPLV